MENVFVCFVKESLLYGKLIRKLTAAEVNHVFFIFHSKEWEDWQAIEIDYRGVIQVSARNTLENIHSIECWYCKTHDLSKGILANKDLIGLGYDWKAIFGYLCKIANKKCFKREIDNPLNDPQKLFCSEFATICLADSGIEWASQLDFNSVNPKNLRTEFKERPHQWGLLDTDIPALIKEHKFTEYLRQKGLVK